MPSPIETGMKYELFGEKHGTSIFCLEIDTYLIMKLSSTQVLFNLVFLVV